MFFSLSGPEEPDHDNERLGGAGEFSKKYWVFLLVCMHVTTKVRYFRGESKRTGREISLRALRSTFVIESKWKDYRVLEMSVTLSTRERLLWGIGVEFTFARKFSLIAPRIYSFFDFAMTNTLISLVDFSHFYLLYMIFVKYRTIYHNPIEWGIYSEIYEIL